MTSILRQQRYSAFVGGVAATAGLYAYAKTQLLQATEEALEQLPGGTRVVVVEEPLPEPMLGATARAWAVRRWNEGVDSVFKPIVQALSRRNL